MAAVAIVGVPRASICYYAILCIRPLDNNTLLNLAPHTNRSWDELPIFVRHEDILLTIPVVCGSLIFKLL